MYEIAFSILEVPDKKQWFSCLCRRAWVFIGTKCNIKCPFCYYKDHQKYFLSLKAIEDQLIKAKQLGMTSVDLSGGEVTVYPDLDALIDLCTRYFSNVSIVTNGIRLSSYSFSRHIYDKGVREVLVSLHGTEETYEEWGLETVYYKIIQGIENCLNLGFKVRINHTATNLSMKTFDKYLTLIQSFNGISQVNFIPMNLWDDNQVQTSRYTIVKHLESYLIGNNFDFEINIRYVPFCFVKQKKYIVGTLQHVFDKHDWAPLFNKYRFKKQVPSLDPNTQYEGFVKLSYLQQLEFRTQTCRYSSACKSCKFYYICDGLQKPSYEVDKEFINPERDDAYITNPVCFRQCISNF